ncbi:Beta-lactamase superfamily domain-containing protein [Clostridium sp. DSM 8431]|nr:Beta-lactamase superfamily domain-containing protein [Clostridium sp. DSM 8431]
MKKEKGKKVSFVTDTRPNKALEDFSLNSHILYCEGTYGDDIDIDKAVKNKHMTFREAANFALNGRVKKLVLTHLGTALINPDEYLHNATEVFQNTVIGEDRLYINLNFSD